MAPKNKHETCNSKNDSLLSCRQPKMRCQRIQRTQREKIISMIERVIRMTIKNGLLSAKKDKQVKHKEIGVCCQQILYSRCDSWFLQPQYCIVNDCLLALPEKSRTLGYEQNDGSRYHDCPLLKVGDAATEESNDKWVDKHMQQKLLDGYVTMPDKCLLNTNNASLPLENKSLPNNGIRSGKDNNAFAGEKELSTVDYINNKPSTDDNDTSFQGVASSSDKNNLVIIEEEENVNVNGDCQNFGIVSEKSLDKRTQTSPSPVGMKENKANGKESSSKKKKVPHAKKVIGDSSSFQKETENEKDLKKASDDGPPENNKKKGGAKKLQARRLDSRKESALLLQRRATNNSADNGIREKSQSRSRGETKSKFNVMPTVSKVGTEVQGFPRKFSVKGQTKPIHDRDTTLPNRRRKLSNTASVSGIKSKLTLPIKKFDPIATGHRNASEVMLTAVKKQIADKSPVTSLVNEKENSMNGRNGSDQKRESSKGNITRLPLKKKMRPIKAKTLPVKELATLRIPSPYNGSSEESDSEDDGLRAKIKHKSRTRKKGNELMEEDSSEDDIRIREGDEKIGSFTRKLQRDDKDTLNKQDDHQDGRLTKDGNARDNTSTQECDNNIPSLEYDAKNVSMAKESEHKDLSIHKTQSDTSTISDLEVGDSYERCPYCAQEKSHTKHTLCCCILKRVVLEYLKEHEVYHKSMGDENCYCGCCARYSSNDESCSSSLTTDDESI